MANTNSLFVRWVVLIAIISNVVFNFTYSYLIPGAGNIKDVTEQYYNLFTPAGYAFSIWGIIYLSFIVYGIYQLLPDRQQNQLYDKLSAPVIFSNILGSAWIIAFMGNKIWLSEIIIIITLLLAMYMFFIIKKSLVKIGWLTIPFSLFFGWISVATIANSSAWLVSIGWHGGGLSESLWTIIMIVVAGFAGFITSITKRDFIYPLVIAWASIAIYVIRKNDYTDIAYTAIVVAVFMVIISLISFAKDKKSQINIEE